MVTTMDALSIFVSIVMLISSSILAVIAVFVPAAVNGMLTSGHIALAKPCSKCHIGTL